MKRRTGLSLPTRKTAGLIVLLCATAAIVMYVRPTHVLIIAGFACMLSFLIYLICTYFLSRKNSAVAAVFVLLFLVSTYLSGFNVLNTILLLCFIIGIKVLLR